MVETVEISGSFRTQLAPVTESAAIANTEKEIGVQGKTEASFAAGLVLGDNGSFTITEINSKEFDTEIPLTGIADGEAELFVIAAGQSQENGGFGSNKVTTVSDLEAELNSLSAPTQQQLSEKLLSLTVNATASKDGQLVSTVLIQPPSISLESVNNNNEFQTSDKVELNGITNVSEKDSNILIEFKDNTDILFTKSISIWTSGTYAKEFVIENNVSNLPPGTYEVTVSVSNTSATRSVSIVDAPEEKRQNTEERTGEDVDTASNEPGANTEQSSESNSTNTVDDESFTGFTQLNKDVYFQPLEFEVEIGDSYWKIIELKIQRQQYQQSGAVDLLAIPDPKENPQAVPESGDDLIINSGPEQSVADANERKIETSERKLGSGGRLERLFTGTVSTVQKRGDGSWKIFGFTSQLDIVTTRIDVSVDDETTITQQFKLVIEKVNEKINGDDIKFKIDFEESPNGIYNNAITFGNLPDSIEKENFKLLRNYTDTTAKSIIYDLELASRGVFWVDKFNVLRFGSPKSKIHKLSFVTESDARIQTPPYKTVKVVGDDVSQSDEESGYTTNHLIGTDSMTVFKSVFQKDNSEYVVRDENLGEPVYTYKDESIRTRREAENVAESLIEDITEQRAEGKIVIPGRPMIDIFDVVEVPNSFAVTKDGTQLPASQYFVKEVIHRVNESDGFVTEITVGGVVNRISGKKYGYISETENGFPKTQLQDGPQASDITGTSTYIQQMTKSNESNTSNNEEEDPASNTGTGRPEGGN